MTDTRQIVVIGGSKIPAELIEQFKAHNFEIVDADEFEEIKPCQSLENFELTARKIQRLEPYQVPRARQGKGEKRRNKKLRGW